MPFLVPVHNFIHNPLDSLSIEIDRLQSEIDTKSFKRKQLEEINRKLTETRNQNNLTLKQNEVSFCLSHFVRTYKTVLSVRTHVLMVGEQNKPTFYF